jgi:glycolate dehydrogenase FAD-binding subunit
MDAGVSSNASVVSGSLEADLRGIVGPEHVRAATKDDVVAGAQPQVIAEPATEQELAAMLKFANETGLAVIPRGGGTKLSWGNPPKRADILLATKRLDKIIEHAWSDMTVTVEAGCSIATLQETLAKHGQRLAFDPLWPERATIGGVLSTNDSGALRLRFGALRDLIIGITLALPDGTIASSGGKVVKNVAGYDLPKLATGALGTLGVITRAVFRLHPLPHNARTLTVAVSDAQETQPIMVAVQNSTLAHTALQARFAANNSAHVDIAFEGTEAGMAAQVTHFANLITPLTATDAPANVWRACQELFPRDPNTQEIAVVKISILPATIAGSIGKIARAARAENVLVRSVLQATGIGCLQLHGSLHDLQMSLQSIRSELERTGGSLTLLERPHELSQFDAWGDPGDALPLMRALQQQFDLKGTLNPGRFVGGI